ncbi:MAG: fused MFS/spermidine synthase [Acidobacteriota bacterium]
MTLDDSKPPQAPRFYALLLLFFLSGATSLVYETVWSRQLSLVFGTTQLAICTLLAAFMAGLALGGALAARFGASVRRPLRAYAVLEALIAVYALAFPWIVALVQPLYLALHAALGGNSWALGVAQSVVLGLALLPPTVCMGATLPLVARFASTGDASTAAMVGRLYGANTFGAVSGVALASFVLLPSLGLSLTNRSAVAANVLLVVAALVWSVYEKPLPLEGLPDDKEETTDDETAHAVTETSEGRLLGIAFLAGFSALLLEVTWFRLLGLLFGGSVYAFSTMLLAFLLGLGLGGWVGGGAADRSFAAGGLRRVLSRLAAVQFGVAALSFGAMHLYSKLPVVFVQLFDRFGPELIGRSKMLMALALMLPPALLMGVTFPYLVRALSSLAARDGVHRPVGRIYAVNTVGAVCGSGLGGLVFLPWLHIQGSVLLAVGANLAASLIALLGPGVRRLPLLFGTAGVLVLAVWIRPTWEPLLMTAGLYEYVEDLEDRTDAGIRAVAVTPHELLFYDEGLSTVVTVGRERENGNVWLANNGKIDASTQGDMVTQLLVAHLPFVFAPEAKDVLVIGLASGISAGAVTLHESPERIDLIEIEPAIVEASHSFSEFNNRPLDDPRVNLIVNDGRNQLLVTPPGTYDLVSAQPSNPWLTGVANLFTQEFFELGRSRLAPGGIWAQWIQTYGMATEDLRSLLGAFSDVFPSVRLFRVDDADLILIGSESPLDLSWERVSSTLWSRPEPVAQLRRELVLGEAQVLALELFDEVEIRRLAKGVERNTDDNMRIEYSAPLHLYANTSEANSDLLVGAAQLPDLEGLTDRQLDQLADAYLTRDGNAKRSKETRAALQARQR